MTDIHHANPSSLGGKDVNNIDIKRASIQVQPVVPTPTLTPALTPDDDDIEAMAGKKIFSLSRPDDKARELAAKLTLEEQVRVSQRCDAGGAQTSPAFLSTCPRCLGAYSACSC
jgi:beta-glucosidase